MIGLDEVVEVGDDEFVGDLDLLVGDVAQALVFHADHDDSSRETAIVQGEIIDFVLTQGAACYLLSLYQHVVISAFPATVSTSKAM